MVNLYRFCIAILFASISFVVAQENCRIEKTKDIAAMIANSQRCVARNYGSQADISWAEMDLNGNTYVFIGSQKLRADPCYQPSIYIEKEICIDPKPDLTDWSNCKKGKDHGFSWITIGDGNGEGESRFKQEFWACDDPDIWIVYNHPPEDKPTDPDPKPTDPDPKPTDPDPKPTDPDGDGGEGGDNGSGNGNDGGSEGGSDNGSNNGGDQNGTGLTKGEVQEAVEGALDSKGQELEGKINKWWLTTQAEMENEGRTMGHAADQLFDNALGNLVADRDIKEFEREYRFELPASKQCPAPIPIKIDFLGIDIQFEFTLICEFLEMMGLLVLASAYITAIYIMLGLRRG